MPLAQCGRSPPYFLTYRSLSAQVEYLPGIRRAVGAARTFCNTVHYRRCISQNRPSIRSVGSNPHLCTIVCSQSVNGGSQQPPSMVSKQNSPPGLRRLRGLKEYKAVWACWDIRVLFGGSSVVSGALQTPCNLWNGSCGAQWSLSLWTPGLIILFFDLWSISGF